MNSSWLKPSRSRWFTTETTVAPRTGFGLTFWLILKCMGWLNCLPFQNRTAGYRVIGNQQPVLLPMCKEAETSHRVQLRSVLKFRSFLEFFMNVVVFEGTNGWEKKGCCVLVGTFAA
ncbi:PREDICTED: uncharacterized protein LOC109341537 [Lupinus angustifolius]|uniref:uncharacterized protein LOC109341537 n=1 Tax=Lupinus angustifolius TaxID=3871 RepID=UPI00092F2172|nr:PREDICTED: uncharacterized protein LOC109341537 [Lupinus angustifolius]